MKLKVVRPLEKATLLDELARIQKRIANRAYEIFSNRGAQLWAALDDWLAAERETIWKPAIDVRQTGREFIIEAAVAGVEPRELDVQATADTVLITADTTHARADDTSVVHVCEFQSGRLFRLITLPEKIDPDSVKAECKNGLLRITAAAAAAKAVRSVDVQAA